jgi:hypothetical protein
MNELPFAEEEVRANAASGTAPLVNGALRSPPFGRVSTFAERVTDALLNRHAGLLRNGAIARQLNLQSTRDGELANNRSPQDQ